MIHINKSSVHISILRIDPTSTKKAYIKPQSHQLYNTINNNPNAGPNATSTTERQCIEYATNVDVVRSLLGEDLGASGIYWIRSTLLYNDEQRRSYPLEVH
eukprot:535048_1